MTRNSIPRTIPLRQSKHRDTRPQTEGPLEAVESLRLVADEPESATASYNNGIAALRVALNLLEDLAGMERTHE